MYFNDCETQEELKKLYRILCKKLHPDNGGDPREFIKMKKEFDGFVNSTIWKTHKTASGEKYQKETSETPAEFAQTIETLLNLAGVIVEICGSWLWITGDTKPYKDTLKQLGGKWSRNKAAWYIHHDKYRKKSKKPLSLEQIRDLYGSKQFTKSQNDFDLLPD